MNQTDKNWGLFLDRLAHDLREPLRSIRSFSELLGEAAKGRLDPQCDRFLEEIIAGSANMGTLIDGLSQYALAVEEEDSGADASLQLAFDTVVTGLHDEIQASGATVTSDRLPRVSVKIERLIQLLGNLIGNSLRFRRKAAPVIHVGAEPVAVDDGAADLWLIRVSDNAIGVPPEYHEAIFKPFARIHGRSFPGAGLGLTICRKIVENHGGTIRVEPGTEVGSVFLFTLPAGS